MNSDNKSQNCQGMNGKKQDGKEKFSNDSNQENIEMLVGINAVNERLDDFEDLPSIQPYFLDMTMAMSTFDENDPDFQPLSIEIIEPTDPLDQDNFDFPPISPNLNRRELPIEICWMFDHSMEPLFRVYYILKKHKFILKQMFPSNSNREMKIRRLKEFLVMFETYPFLTYDKRKYFEKEFSLEERKVIKFVTFHIDGFLELIRMYEQ